MRRARVLVPMGLAVLALIALLVIARPPRAHQAHRIEEDEPGWDCRTMGNRICGPIPTTTMPTVVLQDHPGMACWLEPNNQQPLGVEEICKPGTTGDTTP
jgi:hypothetical protein